jgi:hypothetical protein
MELIIDSEKVFPRAKRFKLDRYFYEQLAVDMLRIVIDEIGRETWQAPAKELIDSWRYNVVGNRIILSSDHPAMTGHVEETEDETSEEKVEEIELPEDEKKALKILKAIPNVAVIQQDGSIIVRKVKTKTLKDGTWVFPSHMKSAFMERAYKRISRLISKQVSRKIRENFLG